MVEITPEGLLIAFGWVTSVVLGLAVFPRIVRKLIAAGLIKPDNPLRKAYALIFDQDVLPKVATLMETALAPWEKKLMDLDDQRKRVEDQIAAIRTEFIAVRKAFDPLLLTVEGQDDQGKPAKASALIFQLDQLIDLAAELRAATTIAVKDKDGNEVQGPIGPNIGLLIDQKLRAHRQMGQARGDGGGGAPTAFEGALVDAEWAIDNPDEAGMLAAAHATIDSLAPVFNWDPKKQKQLHAQANSARGNIDNLRGLMDRLNGLQGRQLLGSGQSGGGGGAPAAKPAHF